MRYKGRFPEPARQRLAILEQNFVSTMSLFPKALVDEIGPFETELAVAEDWDFWLRAIYAGQRVALQPRPLALYRWGSESLSSAPARMDEHVEAVLRRAAERARPDRGGAGVPRAAALRPRASRARAQRRRGAAREALPRGRRELPRRRRASAPASPACSGRRGRCASRPG